MDVSELTGETLAGRFELEELIGEGGYGAVFRAIQLSVNRPCAVKVLSPNLVADDNTVERFRVEARTTSRLNHPNTVVLYDFGQDESHSILFLAMELLEGESLREVVREEGPLGIETTVKIVDQIAGSLQEAHAAGTVHRDVKPHNIMLVERGGDDRFVKVIDFGIAKAVREGIDLKTSLTRTGMMVGTPAYMAPEQVRDRGMDGRTDQYALAMTTYHMLTGSTPFDGGSSMEIASRQLRETPSPVSDYRRDREIPPAFDEVLLQALSKSKEERFDSVEAFARALAEAAESQESTADAIPPVAVDRPSSSSSSAKDEDPNEIDPLSDTVGIEPLEETSESESERNDSTVSGVGKRTVRGESSDLETERLSRGRETAEVAEEPLDEAVERDSGTDPSTDGTLAVPRSEWEGSGKGAEPSDEASEPPPRRSGDPAAGSGRDATIDESEIPDLPPDVGSEDSTVRLDSDSDASSGDRPSRAEEEERSGAERDGPTSQRRTLMWGALGSAVVLVGVGLFSLVSGGFSDGAAESTRGVDARARSGVAASADAAGRGAGEPGADARAQESGVASVDARSAGSRHDADSSSSDTAAPGADASEADDVGAGDGSGGSETGGQRADRAPGTVVVRLIPWGELVVDGRKIGRGGRVEVDLDPGRHVLVLEQNGEPKTRRAISVDSGGRRSIELVAP